MILSLRSEAASWDASPEIGSYRRESWAQPLKCRVMDQELQAQWDQDEADRL